MPPKGKKTKAEEALDFLSNLDSLDVDAPAAGSTAGGAADSIAAPAATAASKVSLEAAPRGSTDSARSRKLDVAGSGSGADAAPSAETNAEEEEAAKALAFLEAQVNTKRAPLSVPSAQSSNVPRPAAGPGANVGAAASSSSSSTLPANIPSQPSEASAPAASTTTTGGGWGSFWSTASSAIQSAQKMADEGYKKVRQDGVGGVTQGLEQLGVKGIDLEGLRKGAEERIAGITKGVQGVDLDKLRHDLVASTTSTLTTLLNTVAPPISEHETLELWLTHSMVGYGGVEGVIYRAWVKVLEQTDSGELVVVWSPPVSAGGDEPQEEKERGMYPVKGWDAGWKIAEEEIQAVRAREEKDPQGRAHEPTADMPVKTIPIFLHLQSVLAPLPVAQPPVLMTASASSSLHPDHLSFIMTLHDPTHSLRFCTVTQPVPGDWLDVEYERSDWVEERLVDVLRVGVEIIAQDYVATRMSLKPSTSTTQTPAPDVENSAAPTKAADAPEDQAAGAKAGGKAKDKKA